MERNLRLMEKVVYILIVVLVALTLLISGLLSSLGYFIDFVTKFLAGVLGVLIGFLLGMSLDLMKTGQDRKRLLIDLRSELVRIKGELTGRGILLYPEVWDSAVSSGQIRLLESEQIAKLSGVYRFVKGTEYEAIRVRDSAEDYRKQEGNLNITAVNLRKRWADYSAIAISREKELSTKIEELLKEKWWDKDKNVIAS